MTGLAMTGLRAALAEDAVLVGRLHLPAASDPGWVRAQLSVVPTPSTRRWVFVRRLTVRASPAGLGIAVRDALERLARGGQQDRVEFADFSTMAVALGRDVRDDTVGLRWFWRSLGLPAMSGAALAAFLRAEPLRAWEALVAWHAAGLLPALWPLLTESAAAAIAADLAQATGSTPLPDRQQEWAGPDPIQTAPESHGAVPFEQAATFWDGALPPSRPALRELAVLLSLLRWQPAAVAHPATSRHATASMRAALLKTQTRTPDRVAEPASAARLPSPALLPAATSPSAPAMVQRVARAEQPARLPSQSEPAATSAEPPCITPDAIPTAFGGVLFLLNALERIGIRRRLQDWPGERAPPGFALLHGLARRSAVPSDDPLLLFLAAQFDPAAEIDGAWQPALDTLYAGLLALFPPEPDELPGLFFLRQEATLVPAPMHLDLYLAATAIDLRVRRAALDRDPGWVEWLGRVVHFHYPTIPTRWARL